MKLARGLILCFGLSACGPKRQNDSPKYYWHESTVAPARLVRQSDKKIVCSVYGIETYLVDCDVALVGSYDTLDAAEKAAMAATEH